MHWSTLNSRLDYAQIVNGVQGTRQGEAVTEKLLASCNQSLGYCDIRTLICYVTLTHQYIGKGDFDAAQRLAQRIILYSQDVEPLNYLPLQQSLRVYLLARSQYELGETASAMANLRQAIEMRMSRFATSEGLAKLWLMELEGWVAEEDNLAYAARLRDWRIQILSSMEAEE